MAGHRRPVTRKTKRKSRAKRHSAMGRERLWKASVIPEICKQVTMLIRDHDWTDGQIAEFYDMTDRTLYRYKIRYPELAKAMLRGEEQRVRMVETALVKSATGFTRRTVKIMQHQGEPILVDHEEFIQPSVPAQVAFLKAKKPEQYSDRLLHTGDAKAPIQFIVKNRDIGKGEDSEPGQ